MIYRSKTAAFSLLNLMGVLVFGSIVYGIGNTRTGDQLLIRSRVKEPVIRGFGSDKYKSRYLFQGSENNIMKDHERVCLDKEQRYFQKPFLPVPRELSCLAFFSSGSGAGKTFLSLGLAQTLAELGRPVLLIDLAGDEASLKSLLHPTSTFSADELILNPQAPLVPETITLNSNFDFLGFKFSQSKTIVMERFFIQNLMKQLSEFSNRYDFFIFDTPGGMSELNLALLQTAISGIFVSTADAENLFDTYALLKAVYPHLSRPDLQLIINRVLDVQSSEEAHQNLQYAMHHFLNQDIRLLAMIPLDGEMQDIELMSQPFPATSPALAKIRQIARSLTADQAGILQTNYLAYQR
jgi:MinD-like ATPase involved in chromosome partitioning or flagellar assembly